MKIKGILSPITTSFDENEEISKKGFEKNFNYWNNFDLEGYLILGTTGESELLTYEEKIQVIKICREFTPKDKIFMVGTGCASTKETIKLTKEASDLGADFVAVLSPYYFKSDMTNEAFIKHYTMVADKSKVPVLIYNMPICTGLDVLAEAIIELSNHPNIIGIKDSGLDVAKLTKIRSSVDKDFSLLTGQAGILLPSLSAGCDGAIIATANFVADLAIEIYDLFQKGKTMECLELQKRMTSLNEVIVAKGSIAGIKTAIETVGGYAGIVRSPLLDITKEEKAGIKEILKP